LPEKFNLTSPEARRRCFNIFIPPDDPHYKDRDCMAFFRSSTGTRIDCKPGPVEQVNKRRLLTSKQLYSVAK